MRKNKKTSLALMIIGVACWALCLSVSGEAQASLITLNFEGLVGFTPPSQSLSIPFNTPIRGFYAFESTTPDLFVSGDPSNVRGHYALSDFSVSFLGKTYLMNPHDAGPKEIRVEDNGFFDSYNVFLGHALGGQAITGPSINGLIPRGFQFNLFGNMSLTSGALPLVPPPLPAGSSFMMNFSDGGLSSGRIDGTITSLTVVPLPGALLLFGSGLLGLLGINVGRRMMAQTK